MNLDFTSRTFTSKNLSLMQNPMNTEDNTLLQKIFTLINILDVNKDGTPQLNQYQDFLSEFFQNLYAALQISHNNLVNLDKITYF